METVALSKYACPACGADAHWNPTRRALVCPYCGTVSPTVLAADGGPIEEHDLASALRAVPASQRGWERERVSVRCQSCKAITLFETSRVAQRCDFCGSSAIVPYTDTRAPITPGSLLPFRIPEAQVRERIRTWYGSHWFAPSRLRRAAMTDTLRGLYVPYWTFDAHVQARWQAEAGHYYYESESFRDQQGNRQVRQVQKVRWEPASGHVQHFFDDELVAATQGIDASRLEAIEPFPTDELVPYDAGYVAGWVVEQYQIDLIAAAERSRRQMDGKVRNYCASQVPGDTHRNLVVEADYSGQTFKHILAPVWVLAYDFGRRKYQVVINGSTGVIVGDHPTSWVKVTLTALAVLLVIALLFAIVNA